MEGIRRACVTTVLLAPACLVPNPTFVEGDSSNAVSASGASDDASTTGTPFAPETTSSSPSSSSSSSSSSTDATEVPDVTETTTGAPTCDGDGYEPNDSESNPALLGPVNDEALPLFVQAVLESPGAEDWYRFEGDDASMLPPTIILDVGASGGVELGVCVFVACVAGTIDEQHMCAGQDAMHNHSVDGYLHGCCATGGVSFQTQCLGAPDNDMTVWMRVAPAAVQLEACIDYVLEYTF